MGKPTKVSDRNAPWYRPTIKRQCRNRAFREYFLIVCEGTRTEPNYFVAISKALPINVIELDIQGEGANTLSLVQRAREIRFCICYIYSFCVDMSMKTTVPVPAPPCPISTPLNATPQGENYSRNPVYLLPLRGPGGVMRVGEIWIYRSRFRLCRFSCSVFSRHFIDSYPAFADVMTGDSKAFKAEKLKLSAFLKKGLQKYSDKESL